jgi:hypothetical protein
MLPTPLEFESDPSYVIVAYTPATKCTNLPPNDYRGLP